MHLAISETDDSDEINSISESRSGYTKFNAPPAQLWCRSLQPIIRLCYISQMRFFNIPLASRSAGASVFNRGHNVLDDGTPLLIPMFLPGARNRNGTLIHISHPIHVSKFYESSQALFSLLATPPVHACTEMAWAQFSRVMALLTMD
ncbi:hypothetical protein PM082_022396 [Marasmius tenuissimus]|nr:hypothetical protein PM082_022396 [Marasmius tenuissimus]